MKKNVAVGIQDYAVLRENDYFYIDKTAFIHEWWSSGDAVTLITRPRRFGKTLNMSMLDYFFSVDHADREDLFEDMAVWKNEYFRSLQGSYPVLFLSFAGVKHNNYETAKRTINMLISHLYKKYEWILSTERFTDLDRKNFYCVSKEMDDSTAALSLNMLCEWLHRYYGKKCIVLLDEYDTPMQEAYVHGYWEELSAYLRALFNNTFKSNSFLERGMMTGITRVSKESIFSDLNNLNVVTTSSDEYATAFGFTENEVFTAMDEQGIDPGQKEKVRFWYDGFNFGKTTDIYNPWSVTMYLDKQVLDTYWANTSGNGLAGRLIREGGRRVKTDFEKLLKGEYVETRIDEQIVFNQLPGSTNALWSLLLASGYLKVAGKLRKNPDDLPVYQLAITNHEVKLMFFRMIEGWFEEETEFGDFISAMFRGDVTSMNHYMNQVALNTFSYFDTGKRPSGRKEPERFYHGFVLGLLVDKADHYLVKSNRESGFGRYDVVMEPKDIIDEAVIMEFKVFDPDNGEKNLEDTAINALRQIEDRQYAADLIRRGISENRILKYGFAFEGEKCLIRKG